MFLLFFSFSLVKIGLSLSWAPTTETVLSRRNIFQSTLAIVSLPIAAARGEEVGSIVKIRLENPGDKLGVEIADTQLRGQNVVVVQKVINNNLRNLQEGMILKYFENSSQ